MTQLGTATPARIVILASGAGSTAQALLDAARDEGFGAQVVAVGTDRRAAPVLSLAAEAGVSTFSVLPTDFESRGAWDVALTAAVGRHRPDLVVLAGFMRLVGAPFLTAFPHRVVNTHPALLPSFPGAHGVRDALAHGVRVTGCTVMIVDEGVDTGPILAQHAVPVLSDDDEASLHERIKDVERQVVVDVVGRMARGGWIVEGERAYLQ